MDLMPKDFMPPDFARTVQQMVRMPGTVVQAQRRRNCRIDYANGDRAYVQEEVIIVSVEMDGE